MTERLDSNNNSKPSVLVLGQNLKYSSTQGLICFATTLLSERIIQGWCSHEKKKKNLKKEEERGQKTSREEKSQQRVKSASFSCCQGRAPSSLHSEIFPTQEK